mmetsp:Transcript_21776/g.37140  ORF Transcript_21776/g.37140 Transcript_21776/m.37140 type:complete len:301 (+) Transcript_21776:54-956(+)
MTMSKEDPSTKMLRSGFGNQVRSDNSTNPAYGFGSQHRDAYLKLYLSQEQSKAMNGNNSQGPVYKTFGGLGPQPDSRYISQPASGFGTSTRQTKDSRVGYPGPGAYTQEGSIGPMVESKRETLPRPVFGTATRDQQSKVWLDDELMKTYNGRGSPGPCTYTTGGGLGKMPDSKYPSQPAWRQGTSERFRHKEDKDMPGVGAYTMNVNAIGKQMQSSKQTLPSAKIGTSDRDAAKKVFISKEHEKASFGLFSPGPVTGVSVNSFGNQTSSAKKTNPSWGFGTGKRDKGNGGESPGPGTYWA